MTDEELRLECLREAVKAMHGKNFIDVAREFYAFLTEKSSTAKPHAVDRVFDPKIMYTTNLTAGGTGGDR